MPVLIGGGGGPSQQGDIRVCFSSNSLFKHSTTSTLCLKFSMLSLMQPRTQNDLYSLKSYGEEKTVNFFVRKSLEAVVFKKNKILNTFLKKDFHCS
jgi:hypothetical protein